MNSFLELLSDEEIEEYQKQSEQCGKAFRKLAKRLRKIKEEEENNIEKRN